MPVHAVVRWTVSTAIVVLLQTAAIATPSHAMCASTDDPGDCAALVDFGNALNYKKWINSANWLSSTSVCTWYGIKCNSKNRVKEINMKNNNLNGNIDKLTSFGNLTAMTEIKIGSSRTPEYKGYAAHELRPMAWSI